MSAPQKASGPSWPRPGRHLSEDVRAAYLANLADYVETHDGILDTSKNGTMHTEYARVVVTLTALGMDATQFQVSDGKTYNLVKPLLDEAAEGSATPIRSLSRATTAPSGLSLP